MSVHISWSMTLENVWCPHLLLFVHPKILTGSLSLMWGGGRNFFLIYKFLEGDRSPKQFAAIHFEIGEKLKKLFLKKKINKSHKIHRNYLSCQIVILRGIFHFFDPKLDFSYISRHALSDYVKKKIFWRYISTRNNILPLKTNQIFKNAQIFKKKAK